MKRLLYVHNDEHKAPWKYTSKSIGKSKRNLEIKNRSTISKTSRPRPIKQGKEQQKLQLINRSQSTQMCNYFVLSTLTTLHTLAPISIHSRNVSQTNCTNQSEGCQLVQQHPLNPKNRKYFTP